MDCSTPTATQVAATKKLSSLHLNGNVVTSEEGCTSLPDHQPTQFACDGVGDDKTRNLQKINRDESDLDHNDGNAQENGSNETEDEMEGDEDQEDCSIFKRRKNGNAKEQGWEEEFKFLNNSARTHAVECGRKIKVNQAHKLYDNPTYYSMKSEPRGHALVIVNSRFAEPLSAADKTFQNLVELFSGLGYFVHASKDQTCEEMKKRIARFSRLKDHCKMDSCVVAISSHGGGVDEEKGKNMSDREYLRGTDKGGRLYKNEILSPFSKGEGSALYRKPKLFFLEGYRGKKQDDDMDGEEGPYEDMCIFSSSQQDYVLYNNKNFGTRFTKAVTEVFAEYACCTPFTELREEVKKIMTEPRFQLPLFTAADGGKNTLADDGKERKVHQILEWEDFFLAKTLYFNPSVCLQRCIDEPGRRCKKC